MKYLMLAFVLFTAPAMADQFSIGAGSLLNATHDYYVSNDRRIQYNFGGDKYWFLQYRRAGICPLYCGFNYDMFGAGYGRRHKVGIGKIFIQVGAYYVKNTVGGVKYDENLFYYLNGKFKDFENPQIFDRYEVENDKHTYGITIGWNVPLFKNSGVAFSYQSLRVNENIKGFWQDSPGVTKYWQDPVKRDLSMVVVGFYVDF